MPSSPAVRVSRGREMRVTENPKRGRSLESRIHYRENDDDLALFSEMQNKEREDFLLQSNDDFDDIFSTKLRSFSDYKLGISIPAQGESSDLLNAEGDKNDYDWLITPPETPLFSSLDDETPPPHLTPRGRPRSQPVSISRSPTMEKGYRSNRSSASPRRLSPSPSFNNPLTSRSQPFSATHSSPPPTFRRSPTRGPSPPTRKLSPAPRSITPTPRRLSTGSTGPSRVRCNSPSKTTTTRGNSTSPKLSAWQSNNIPGFSSEVPPNLRTSLADRPASYVRGSSPASRNGSTRSGRQSMSPTGSRSVSSSHSHDKDPFGSHSKGSIASSADDDLDSLHSTPVSSSYGRSAPRSVGPFPSSKTSGFSRKLSTASSSSAPKRSFDLALRQMDRKGTQQMFRPLLSSVPSSTFYAGKANGQNRSLISRNSSITTSSNASSDPGTSGPIDTEEMEQNQEDVTSNNANGIYTDFHEDVFTMDALAEDSKHSVIKELSFRLHDEVELATPVDPIMERKYDSSHVDVDSDVLFCSMCGLGFHSYEVINEGEPQLCLECKSSKVNYESSEIFDHFQPVLESPKSIEMGEIGVKLSNHLDNISTECPDLIIEANQDLATENVVSFPLSSSEPTENLATSAIGDDDEASCPQQETIGVPEGYAGISLLLKRSSSGKKHLVQSRSFTASNLSYDDFSFVTDSQTSMRTSIGHSSGMSSSVDLGSSRQSETRTHRQLSGRKLENNKCEIPSKHKRSSSSFSGTSGSHVGVVPNMDLHEQSVSSEIEAESTSTDAQWTSKAEITTDSADILVTLVLASEDLEIDEHGQHLSNNSGDLTNVELETQNKDAIQNSCSDEVSVETLPIPSSSDAISELEIVDESEIPADSSESSSCTDEVVDPEDITVETVEEFEVSDPVHVDFITEESTVILDNNGGKKPRSLTLDEATDTILFCSSIVHNIAYEAANIAIEKEKPPMEVLRPTVPLVGKSIPDRREIRSRSVAKRNSKTQKTREKFENDTNTPHVVYENYEKSRTSPRIVRDPNKSDTMKPPKLESKCNCTIM